MIMIPHRSTALIAIIVFVALLLVVLSSSPNAASQQAVASAAKFVPRPKLPSWSSNIHSPLRPAVHKPPEDKNSSSGESSWFSDWTWLNPFSSSITLDENRSVLPPLRERLPVYTYYDTKDHNVQYEREADAELLLAWRRAWFAQGFRPVVLSRGEAMNNKLYEAVQNLKLSAELETDMLRWLAWGNMGTGLLADLHCFPMARYDDRMLSYLRRGAVPTHITRFERLGNGLFAGEKAKINDAIKEAIDNVDEKSKSVSDFIPTNSFKVEDSSALAFYSSNTITIHYPAIVEKIAHAPAAGRLSLVELINSHLHQNFQNVYPGGIAVLRPFPKVTTALVEPNLLLAKALARCPSSPLTSSCPPNRERCQTCGTGTEMPITQPSSYKNTSQLFTIGTLPHPYTLICLQKGSDDITTGHIRRETERDSWLGEVTKNLLEPEAGSSSRAVVFKDAVAGDAAIGSSLWTTVESLPAKPGETLPSTFLDELEWQFGFKIPRDTQKAAHNNQEQTKNKAAIIPSKESVEQEYELLAKARETLKSKDSNRIGIKDVAEAWNLVDTEAWRFVRAYRARSVVERQKWEEEEKNFVGAT